MKKPPLQLLLEGWFFRFTSVLASLRTMLMLGLLVLVLLRMRIALELLKPISRITGQASICKLSRSVSLQPLLESTIKCSYP